MQTNRIPYVGGLPGLPKARVLLADPQTIFCAAVTRHFNLEADVFDATWAAGVRAVTRKISAKRPHVVLLAASFDNRDPRTMISLVRRAGAETPPRIVLLDDRLQMPNLRVAIDMGAHGYWTKRRTPRELHAAVLAAARGQYTFCPQSRRHITVSRGRVSCRAGLDHSVFGVLTPREHQVALMLARGLTVKQCAAELGLAVSSVDNYKWRLMRKLDIHRSVDLTLLAIREGLLG